MRVAAALFPAKNLLKQFHHPSRGCGILATSTPMKHRENHKPGAEEKAGMTERADPIVAFSRPPPLPPVLGPLLALSLFEAWSGHDNNDG